MAATDGFPDGFLWGASSSSVGAEGASPASDWSAWERSGRVPASAEGAGWASDFANDAQLFASLGLGALLITIEWARLEPAPGKVDHERVEREMNVVDAVRAAGLQPWLVLQHGSLPGWFADDEGGFGDERARSYFWPRHVDRCAEWFEDLAAGWAPIHDPVGWALRGHLLGSRPPGRRDPRSARDAVIGALEANHAAWRLLRGGAAPVMSILGLATVRAADAGARDAARFWDAMLWQAPLKARREGILDVPGGAALERPEMAGAFDLVGLAGGYPVSVAADGTPGPSPATAPCDGTGFAPNAEELGEVLRRLAEEAPGAPLVVASHGVATDDDEWRERLLREAVDEVRSAIHDGVDVRGYFHEAGLDGYEWDRGFSAPTGLVGRDRRVKPSGRFLETLLRPAGD